ncbi:hypothetical protein BP5796_06342 [Coleophoma crateriformis]|uniref:Uncharacterized protein n=1 Tax=Coleophoma crateriformis TaxID=565419 RepID=A0A3D8RX29_9HELO|nr:hypothetical protein BP5796_06342 [Coleophoma crateriformis]
MCMLVDTTFSCGHQKTELRECRAEKHRKRTSFIMRILLCQNKQPECQEPENAKEQRSSQCKRCRRKAKLHMRNQAQQARAANDLYNIELANARAGEEAIRPGVIQSPVVVPGIRFSTWNQFRSNHGFAPPPPDRSLPRPPQKSKSKRAGRPLKRSSSQRPGSSRRRGSNSQGRQSHDQRRDSNNIDALIRDVELWGATGLMLQPPHGTSLAEMPSKSSAKPAPLNLTQRRG